LEQLYSLEYGGTPPWWMLILVAAEFWGIAPWEIDGTKSKLWWLTRWLKYMEVKSKIQQWQSKNFSSR